MRISAAALRRRRSVVQHWMPRQRRAGSAGVGDLGPVVKLTESDIIAIEEGVVRI